MAVRKQPLRFAGVFCVMSVLQIILGVLLFILHLIGYGFGTLYREYVNDNFDPTALIHIGLETLPVLAGVLGLWSVRQSVGTSRPDLRMTFSLLANVIFLSGLTIVVVIGKLLKHFENGCAYKTDNRQNTCAMVNRDMDTELRIVAIVSTGILIIVSLINAVIGFHNYRGKDAPRTHTTYIPVTKSCMKFSA